MPKSVCRHAEVANAFQCCNHHFLTLSSGVWTQDYHYIAYKQECNYHHIKDGLHIQYLSFTFFTVKQAKVII